MTAADRTLFFCALDTVLIAIAQGEPLPKAELDRVRDFCHEVMQGRIQP